MACISQEEQMAEVAEAAPGAEEDPVDGKPVTLAQ